MNKYQDMYEKNIDFSIEELENSSFNCVDRYYIFSNLARQYKRHNDYQRFLFCFSASEVILAVTMEAKLINTRASEFIDDTVKEYLIDEQIAPIEERNEYHYELVGAKKFDKESKIIMIVSIISIVVFLLLSIFVFKISPLFTLIYITLVAVFQYFIFPRIHAKAFMKKLIKEQSETFEIEDKISEMFDHDKAAMDHFSNKYGELIRALSEEEINRAIMKLPKDQNNTKNNE